MTSDANPEGRWERVAAELRACRDAQRRAWGDIDNTTLGRYLADEVSRDEREQIESALKELPELRKLTELVRDVLVGSDVIFSEPSMPYGPATVPFAQSPTLPATSMRPAAHAPSRTAGPSRGWKPQGADARFRQRAGLIAAAAVLLALGLGLPRSGVPSSQADFAVAMSPALASRGDGPFALTMAGSDALPQPLDNGAPGDRREKPTFLARIDASVQALEAEGKKSEAQSLARQYASNLTRQALFFQEKGDLIQAEPALNHACELYSRALGPTAPETIRNRKSLAGVYETALNTAPSVGDARRAVNAPEVRLESPADPPGITSPGASRMTKASPSPDVRTAVPGGSAKPPVRSSSAYGPSQMGKRSSLSSAFHYGVEQPRLLYQRYQNARINSSIPTPPAGAALRDRLTNQSQSELKASVVPVLTQALREATNSTERQRLAQALGQLGPAAREAVPVLLTCYRQAVDVSERSTLLLAFGQIGPSARAAIPVLLQSLRSESSKVRDCAVRALIQLGPAARASCRAFAKKTNSDALVRDLMRRLDGPEGRIGIEDECGCFSVKAIQQTQQEINRLAAVHHVEVRIETAPRAEKDLEERRREMGEYSVYVRMNKETPRVQVRVSDALRQQGLTEDHLREVLEPYLKHDDHDRSLREGLLFLARFEKERTKK